MIRKRGEYWMVMNRSGSKTLGKHRNKSDAEKQLAAIEISKKKHRGII